jgi:HSP20 family protein
VEVLRTEGELLIRVELPGVDPERAEVAVSDGVLSVRAERQLQAPEGAEYLRRELAHGTYHRELTLPEGVDPERMTARYEGGILEIRVPYQASRAVRIPVEIASSEPKALKATA